jgi:hypothetical protein
MTDDAFLRPYIKDPEVVLMLANASQMRKRSVAAAPGLGETVPPTGQPFVNN